MLEFYTSNQEIIRLAKELGRGGEGAVFEVVGRPELVAKIYHEPVSPDKAAKLQYMAACHDEQLLQLTAWVSEVLFEQSNHNKIVGFLMPRLEFDFLPLHELYTPRSRRLFFPTIDYRFLVRTAANLARAFAIVHAHGHAIGDVNHGNVVVSTDTSVKLIDCDSYQINTREAKNYLCEVGVSTHTPPELQGCSLRGVERTANHDLFGLAVLIFQLLFMGRHPFSGKWMGAGGDQTLEEAIKERRFAYGAGAADARQMLPPPGTLLLEELPPRIAELFERAFLEIEERPRSEEWIKALEELQQQIIKCKRDDEHYYWQQLQLCPWCELEKITGVEFFADPMANAATKVVVRQGIKCQACQQTIKQSDLNWKLNQAKCPRCHAIFNVAESAQTLSTRAQQAAVFIRPHQNTVQPSNVVIDKTNSQLKFKIGWNSAGSNIFLKFCFIWTGGLLVLIFLVVTLQAWTLFIHCLVPFCLVPYVFLGLFVIGIKLKSLAERARICVTRDEIQVARSSLTRNIRVATREIKQLSCQSVRITTSDFNNLYNHWQYNSKISHYQLKAALHNQDTVVLLEMKSLETLEYIQQEIEAWLSIPNKQVGAVAVLHSSATKKTRPNIL